MGVSILVGMVFGLYPAWRAAGSTRSRLWPNISSRVCTWFRRGGGGCSPSLPRGPVPPGLGRGLGAGKTTLLNHILTANHGKRIAVIENEFGEIGVDQDLVINAEEEIFEMNNGCICCTVRGDLIRILGNLMKRRDKFDYILIETTGLADPGPVAQTFFMDDEMQAKTAIDGIVTLVDAKHVLLHWDSHEVQEQIAFADVILLNKTDLVTRRNWTSSKSSSAR